MLNIWNICVLVQTRYYAWQKCTNNTQTNNSKLIFLVLYVTVLFLLHYSTTLLKFSGIFIISLTNNLATINFKLFINDKGNTSRSFF